MYSPNRRKVCQVEIQKQAYLRHINRLEELKDGRSPEQLRRNRQQKKLVQTISIVRRMHTYNRQFKQKQMKDLQHQSKEVDFNKIKSVVVQDFNRPIPSIAPKHKRDQKPIYNENIKLFERIINAKSNVNSRNNGYTQRKNKILPCISSSDFSKLYETSRINANEGKIIKIKLGKAKKTIKVKIQLLFNQLFQIIKDLDTMYFLEASYGQLKSRSPSFIVGELQISTIILRVPEKGFKASQISIKLVKILDTFQKKQVVKARFCGSQQIQNKYMDEQKENEGHKIYSSIQTPRQSKDIYNSTSMSQVNYKYKVRLKLLKENRFTTSEKQKNNERQNESLVSIKKQL